jgi:DNA repair protein RadC
MKENDKKSLLLGHRHRLRERFMDGKIAEYELLELLLSYAILRRDVKPIAKSLMAEFGNIHKILTAGVSELCQVEGISNNTAVFLRAIYEVILLDFKQRMSDQPLLNDSKQLVEYCRFLLMGKTTEEFHVLYLDSVRRLIRDDRHAQGTINQVTIYPREILKQSLDSNAKYVVLVHNHPDGNQFFSEADIKLTYDLKTILSAAEIDIIDHLLVVGGSVFSARDMMLFK